MNGGRKEQDYVHIVGLCRVNSKAGFEAIDACSKREREGGCPVEGQEYEVGITQKPGSLAANYEIAEKLSTCSVCGFDATPSDFTYLTNASKRGLPIKYIE